MLFALDFLFSVVYINDMKRKVSMTLMLQKMEKLYVTLYQAGERDSARTVWNLRIDYEATSFLNKEDLWWMNNMWMAYKPK